MFIYYITIVTIITSRMPPWWPWNTSCSGEICLWSLPSENLWGRSVGVFLLALLEAFWRSRVLVLLVVVCFLLFVVAARCYLCFHPWNIWVWNNHPLGADAQLLWVVKLIVFSLNWCLRGIETLTAFQTEQSDRFWKLLRLFSDSKLFFTKKQ